MSTATSLNRKSILYVGIDSGKDTKILSGISRIDTFKNPIFLNIKSDSLFRDAIVHCLMTLTQGHPINLFVFGSFCASAKDNVLLGHEARNVLRALPAYRHTPIIVFSKELDVDWYNREVGINAWIHSDSSEKEIEQALRSVLGLYSLSASDRWVVFNKVIGG